MFLPNYNFFLVADEEGTIEEQEMMEGDMDHKSELADLTKDGNNLLCFLDVCMDSLDKIFAICHQQLTAI